MTPTVMSAELMELLERYRRKSTHLVKPSTLPWQVALDAETYGKADAPGQEKEMSLRSDVSLGDAWV